MKIISVIIPLYFGEKYIPSLISMFEKNKRTLNGLAKLEVIFIKDSLEPWKQTIYSHPDFDIKILSNTENQGIQYSRAKGITAAVGDYIHMLDQDDTITDNYYYSQLCKIGNKDMIVCNGIKEYETYNKLLYRFYPMQLTVKFPFFYTHFSCRILSPGQCLLKKKCIPSVWLNNILKHSGTDDFFLWLLLFQEKIQIGINRQQLYRHTHTGDNLSLNTNKMNMSLEEMIKLCYSLNCVKIKWLKTIERRQLCIPSKPHSFLTKIVESINRER